MAKIEQLPSGNYRTRVYIGKDSNGKDKYKSITAPSKREVKLKIAEFLAEREDKRLKKQNENLQADFDNLKEMLRLEKRIAKSKYTDPKQLDAVARFLLKHGESEYSKDALVEKLNDLYVYMQDGLLTSDILKVYKKN